jgi:predicted RNA-binding Zn-ribbon protein involved in translation (DUF1610 family)
MTNKLTARLLAIAGKLAGVIPGVPDGTGPHGWRKRNQQEECPLGGKKEIESEAGPKIARAGEPRIDALRRILTKHQYEKIDGYQVDAQTANMLVTVYDSLAKRGHDMSRFDRIPLPKLVDFGWSQVRSASTEGLKSRRAEVGMWRGHLPATCDFCHKPITGKWFVDGNTNWGSWANMCPNCFMMNGVGIGPGKGQKYDAVTGRKLQGSDFSEIHSRRAMYWGGPDRVYRLTRTEQENGTAVCPKCKKEMQKEPFTKSDKLYTCESCGFKVPTSKTTTTRVTIDVDKDTGEVDVDVTTAKGRRGTGSTVVRELTAIEFPTQDAYDKYMKEHPDADKSLHRVVETKKETPAKEEKTERKPVVWKKKQLDLPIGKQIQYKGEGYTIDLNVAPSEDQGHPGSNIVSISDKHSYLNAKKFKSIKEAEDYVEELKKKLEKGESLR